MTEYLAIRVEVPGPRGPAGPPASDAPLGPVSRVFGYDDGGESYTQIVGDVDNDQSFALTGTVSASPFTYKDDATVSRPIVRRLRETLSLKDVHTAVTGVAGDDATAYILEWAEYIRTYKTKGTVPRGTYDHSVKLDDHFYGDQIVLEGDNKNSTFFRYTGGAFTSSSDVAFKVGSASHTTAKAVVRGLGFLSSTTQALGWGFMSDAVTQGRYDIRVDDGARKQKGGIWARGSNYVNFRDSEVASTGTKFAVSDCIEVYTDNMQLFGELDGSSLPMGGGIVVGGGVGGFYWGGQLLYAAVGLTVDKSLSTAANTQIITLPNSWIDSCKDALIKLDDNSSANYVGRLLVLRGNAGTCVAGPGLWVKNWKGRVLGAGGLLTNIYGDGIYIEDVDARVSLPNANQIANIFGGYGVNASVAVTIEANAQPINTGLGAYGPNVTVTQEVHGTQTLRLDPTSEWLFDGTQHQIAFNAGADVTLPVGGGIVNLAILETGDSITVEVNGGAVNMLSYNGTSTAAGYVNMTASPSSGHWSVVFSGGRYHAYSNLSGTKTLVLTPLHKNRASV